MSEKKADKLRYWVTYLPKDLQEGSSFKPDQIHLTIVPWFVTHIENTQVISSFRKQFAKEKNFYIKVGKLGEFKNSRKIPVNFIDYPAALKMLHRKTLNWLDLIEARWAVKSPYVGEQYIPHVRRRRGHNLTVGQDLKFSSLSLVSARRRGDDVRTVIAKVDFHD